MIIVVGEALIDLVIDPSGAVSAALGGGPFNAARAGGRLGADIAFAGSVGRDRFGDMLLAQLTADAVTTDFVARTDAPTTLAIAELDAGGAASYRFYIDGTAAPAYVGGFGDARPAALLAGGLGLELEPMAETVDSAIAASPRSCLVMVDVNCRPRVIRDRNRYSARVERLLARTDVVKVSDEDVSYLFPGEDPVVAARSLLDRGPRAVLLTAGGESVRVLTAGDEVTVPVPAVAVVDTIGAGDSFSGGFLAWWQLAGNDVANVGSLTDLVPAVQAAIEVAGVVCTRRGADPPRRHELSPAWTDL